MGAQEFQTLFQGTYNCYCSCLHLSGPKGHLRNSQVSLGVDLGMWQARQVL